MNKRSYKNLLCFQWGNEKTIDMQSTTSQDKKLHRPSSYHFKFIDDRENDECEEIYIKCEILLKTYRLGFSPDDTVEQIKNKLQIVDHIPINLQILYFNDIALCNHQNLIDLGIKNKSTLFLKIKLYTAFCKDCDIENQLTNNFKPVTITLKSLSNDLYQADVILTNPTEDLKMTLDKKYGFFPDQLLIVHEGKMLEDDISLSEYGLDETDELILILYEYDNCTFCAGCALAQKNPMVELEFLNTSTVWALHPEFTVRQFKETSYNYLHHIHPDMQKVIYKNQELKDESILEEYGIQDGDVISIKLCFNRRKCDECGKPL